MSTTVAQSIDHTASAGECVLNAIATQSSVLLLTLVADAGESVGAQVQVCLMATFEQSATTEGDDAAKSTIGGGSGVGPAVIVRNPSGSPVTVFSFGPATVMGNEPPLSAQKAQTFGAQIGDEIRVELGDAAMASGTGIGGASTNASAESNCRSGAWAPAPSMTPVGMAALTLLLLAFGTLSLRLRR